MIDRNIICIISSLVVIPICISCSDNKKDTLNSIDNNQNYDLLKFVSEYEYRVQTAWRISQQSIISRDDEFSFPIDGSTCKFIKTNNDASLISYVVGGYIDGVLHVEIKNKEIARATFHPGRKDLAPMNLAIECNLQ